VAARIRQNDVLLFMNDFLFDPENIDDFNADYVVLCHELGHVITWFCYGEEIGCLKCCRCTDNLIEARVTLPPNAKLDELLHTPKYAMKFAERLLAGEISARHALGKRTDQICSKGLPVGDGPDQLAKAIAQTNPNSNLAKEDVFKVLQFAINHGQSGWYAWIVERMSRARDVVNQNWAAIDQIARRLEPRLPAIGKTQVWTKDELLAEMKKCGIHSCNYGSNASTQG